MYKRIFLIVLDSLGIGNAPDAEDFNDKGSNTLKSISASPKFDMPCMQSLGFFNIDGVDCAPKEAKAKASFARLIENSKGKDTTIGHWEIAGVESAKALPTFPNGFPDELIAAFSEKTGKGVLCNKPYSGTDVLQDFGEEHLKTGKLIVYTSADSVFQIAAHEGVVPIEALYEYCEIARELLVGDFAVGRVIARPFIGDTKDTFKRTSNRHDVSLLPPAKTMLDYLTENNLASIGVGKIYDIFAGVGVGEKIKSVSNENGMDLTIQLAKRDFNGIAFVNLVDFDMLFGHRNDIDGYANAASVFDKQLSQLLPLLNNDDLLMITADHGCDPGFNSTDHTRECVPLIIYSKSLKNSVNLGTLKGFGNIAATVCDALGVNAKLDGKSILPLLS